MWKSLHITKPSIPLFRLVECEVIAKGEIEKFGMADHIWRRKCIHSQIVQIIYRENCWRVRKVKRAASFQLGA